MAAFTLKGSIDAEAKAITKKLRIDERVEVTAQTEAFVTLKDHKEGTSFRGDVID